MPANKGKIAVLIEDHFDGTEYRRFNEFFPLQGYQVDYVSHLWGQPSLTFGNNPDDGVVDLHATVTTEVNNVKPADYAGVILIGAYAMDRLRYQEKVKPGQPNQAPAVRFLHYRLNDPLKEGAYGNAHGAGWLGSTLVVAQVALGLMLVSGGTLLMAGHDWDRPALWRRSMELLARDVMPRFGAHAAATPAR